MNLQVREATLCLPTQGLMEGAGSFPRPRGFTVVEVRLKSYELQLNFCFLFFFFSLFSFGETF